MPSGSDVITRVFEIAIGYKALKAGLEGAQNSFESFGKGSAAAINAFTGPASDELQKLQAQIDKTSEVADGLTASIDRTADSGKTLSTALQIAQARLDLITEAVAKSGDALAEMDAKMGALGEESGVTSVSLAELNEQLVAMKANLNVNIASGMTADQTVGYVQEINDLKALTAEMEANGETEMQLTTEHGYLIASVNDLNAEITKEDLNYRKLAISQAAAQLAVTKQAAAIQVLNEKLAEQNVALEAAKTKQAEADAEMVAATGISAKLSAAVGGVGTMLKGVLQIAPMVGIGLTLAFASAMYGIVKMADSVNATSASIVQLSNVLGIGYDEQIKYGKSVNTGSEYLQTFLEDSKLVGLQSEDTGNYLQMFSRSITTMSAATLASYGITTTQMIPALMQYSTWVKTANSQTSLAATQILFGGTAAKNMAGDVGALNKVLEQGASGLTAQTNYYKSLGVVMSDASVQSNALAASFQGQLGVAFQGVENDITTAVDPALTTLMTVLSSALTSSKGALASFSEWIIDAGIWVASFIAGLMGIQLNLQKTIDAFMGSGVPALNAYASAAQNAAQSTANLTPATTTSTAAQSALTTAINNQIRALQMQETAISNSEAAMQSNLSILQDQLDLNNALGDSQLSQAQSQLQGLQLSDSQQRQSGQSLLDYQRQVAEAQLQDKISTLQQAQSAVVDQAKLEMDEADKVDDAKKAALDQQIQDLQNTLSAEQAATSAANAATAAGSNTLASTMQTNLANTGKIATTFLKNMPTGIAANGATAAANFKTFIGNLTSAIGPGSVFWNALVKIGQMIGTLASSLGTVVSDASQALGFVEDISGITAANAVYNGIASHQDPKTNSQMATAVTQAENGNFAAAMSGNMTSAQQSMLQSIIAIRTDIEDWSKEHMSKSAMYAAAKSFGLYSNSALSQKQNSQLWDYTNSLIQNPSKTFDNGGETYMPTMAWLSKDSRHEVTLPLEDTSRTMQLARSSGLLDTIAANGGTGGGDTVVHFNGPVATPLVASRVIDRINADKRKKNSSWGNAR